MVNLKLRGELKAGAPAAPAAPAAATPAAAGPTSASTSEAPPRKRQLWVGVAGPPGAGKSTTARLVAEQLRAGGGVRAVAVPMDGYHLTRAELSAMPNAAEAHEKRGAPWTFAPARLAADLAQARRACARAGGSFAFPDFDHAVGDPVPAALRVRAEDEVVLLEGNYLLLPDGDWPRVRAQLDLVVFLDVPEALCCQRLAERHAKAWGWDLERAAARVARSDLANVRLVAQTQPLADAVVALKPDGGGLSVTMRWS